MRQAIIAVTVMVMVAMSPIASADANGVRALQTSCAAGFYSADGTSATTCKRCPAGSISTTTGSTSCSPCDVGKFQNQAGKTSCKLCPSGTYSGTTGATACTRCAAGTFSAASGAVSCEDCAVGYFQNQAGKSSCRPCFPGSYSATTAATSCTPCDAGSVSLSGATECTQCTAGTFEDHNICKQCKAGSYSDVDGASRCTKCPPGTYADAAGATACDDCPAGTRSARSSSLRALKSGASDASGISSAESDSDSDGPSSGATRCVTCAAGTYAAAKSATCSTCAADTFSRAGAETCTPCAANGDSAEGASQCTCTSAEYSVCPTIPSYDCSIWTAGDVANCGTCGTVCPTYTDAISSCSAGVCGATCKAGFGDCDANLATNGCETPLTSVQYCGSCDISCPTYTDATSSCSAGVCGATCNAGFGDCDADLATNGCEIKFSELNDDHCGNCATSCTALGLTCQLDALTSLPTCL